MMAAESLEQYSDTARLRYGNGNTSFIEWFDAERNLFNVQLILADPADTTAGHGQYVQNHGRRLGSGSAKFSVQPAEK